MTHLAKAYLGLGANLGDPIQQLIEARQLLRDWSNTEKLRCSSFYLSSPVGYAEQPNFVNCVVELVTNCDVDDLFSRTQQIEDDLGRLRNAHNRNAPRLIDIDLLLFGTQKIDKEYLVVPHARLCQRLFVLEPLAELLTDRKHPLLGELDKILASGSFEGQVLHRLVF